MHVRPLRLSSAHLLLRWAEAVYLVAALLALTLGPVYTVRLRMAPLEADFTADLATQTVFVVIYGVAAVLLARTAVRWWRLRRPLLAVGGLCALLVFSTTWSVRPTDTFATGLLTTATALFGVYLALRWSPLAIAGGLYVSSLIGVGSSLWAIQRNWPGAKDNNADWAGVYLNRNSLGPVATMGVLSGLFVVASLGLVTRQASATIRRRLMFGTVLTAVPIYPCYRVLRHTRSFTGVAGALAALIVAALLVLLLAAGRRWPMLRRLAPVILAGVAAIGAVAVDVGRDRLATSVDKLPTLSGRTIIWRVVRHWFHLRPSKGWGWMAIWRYPPFRADLDSTGYHVFSAHSGYLEVALAAGWLGVVVLAVALVVVIAGVLIWSAQRADLAGVWCTALLTYCLVVNTSETYIGANLLPWALLVSVGVGAAHNPNDSGLLNEGSTSAIAPNARSGGG